MNVRFARGLVSATSLASVRVRIRDASGFPRPAAISFIRGQHTNDGCRSYGQTKVCHEDSNRTSISRRSKTCAPKSHPLLIASLQHACPPHPNRQIFGVIQAVDTAHTFTTSYSKTFGFPYVDKEARSHAHIVSTTSVCYLHRQALRFRVAGGGSGRESLGRGCQELEKKRWWCHITRGWRRVEEHPAKHGALHEWRKAFPTRGTHRSRKFCVWKYCR